MKEKKCCFCNDLFYDFFFKAMSTTSSSRRPVTINFLFLAVIKSQMFFFVCFFNNERVFFRQGKENIFFSEIFLTVQSLEKFLFPFFVNFKNAGKRKKFKKNHGATFADDFFRNDICRRRRNQKKIKVINK